MGSGWTIITLQRPLKTDITGVSVHQLHSQALRANKANQSEYGIILQQWYCDIVEFGVSFNP